MKFIASLSLIPLVALASLPALAAGVPGMGTWESTLQARDLDGNGVSDAYYDTVLDLTWFYHASPFGLDDGTWAAYTKMAEDLVVGHLSDWRLPHATDLGDPGCVPGQPDCGSSLDLSKSEYAHLYFVTLGNSVNDGSATPRITNSGPFSGFDEYGIMMLSGAYPQSGESWAFSNADGLQISVVSNVFTGRSLFVRDGDIGPGYIPGGVPAIPEPGTYAMMLAGLALTGVLARHRRRF